MLIEFIDDDKNTGCGKMAAKDSNPSKTEMEPNSIKDEQESSPIEDTTTYLHRLTFNVTSVGRDEDIYLAELRLFRLYGNDSSSDVRAAAQYKVAVYEVVSEPSMNEIDYDYTRCGGQYYEVLSSNEIVEHTDGWETFTLTDAARRWIKHQMPGLHVRRIYKYN